MAHTPGPWFQLTGGSECVNISNTVGPHWAGPKHHVARVSHCKPEDAALLAAAPDLLAALESLLFNVEHGNGSSAWDTSKDKARAAIAKARGA